MGTRERYAPGTFCWADLGVADRDASKAFYSHLFGWDHSDQTGPRGNVYTTFEKGGHAVAALREGPPVWFSYVAVESVDDSVERATGTGASVAAEARDIPPAGRIAVVTDPQGAHVGLWQAGAFAGAGLVNEPGSMVWQQLTAPDLGTAQDWYAGQFGWTWADLPGVPGWLEARNGENRLMGGASAGPEAGWQLVFTVEDCARACERVEELGGRTLEPPADTAIGVFATVADQQGSAFGVFAGETDP